MWSSMIKNTCSLSKNGKVVDKIMAYLGLGHWILDGELFFGLKKVGSADGAEIDFFSHHKR